MYLADGVLHDKHICSFLHVIRIHFFLSYVVVPVPPRLKIHHHIPFSLYV